MISKTVMLSALSIMMLMGCKEQEINTGSVSLDITDAAVTNVKQVYIAVSSVSLHGPDGTLSYKLSDDVRDYIQYPLLDYAGDVSASLLKDAHVAAGAYQWIQLNLATEDSFDSYVELDDGTVHELTIASEAGLKLNRGFYVPVDGDVRFTLDLDLQKSLIKTATGYELKPVIRVVNNYDIGKITGHIDSSLLSSKQCDQASVYLFRGYDAALAEADPETDPELVVPVDLHEGNDYRLGFITAGEYSLALACDSATGPGAEEQLTFLQQKNVLVQSSYTSVVHMDL